MVVALVILMRLFSLALGGAGMNMIYDGLKKHEHDCAAVGAIVLVAAVAGLVVMARIAMGAV